VAHDFNNILSAINGYAEMCLSKMEEDNPFRSKIETILESGQRASRLTQQLLAFSRKQIIHPQSIDVGQSLQGIKKMLGRILGEDIEISMVVGPDLWHVHADQTQFEQVLINMAVNARDAMPQGGKLTFEAKNAVLDQAYVERHYEIGAGEYVLLAISDNGQGMDKETMAKIFEPFFTTKEMGKGTGLGLATVYGIIKQSGGEILVYSEPDQGTTFKIYLPRHEEAAAVPAIETDKPEMAMGTETVLLVEDDEVVRTMTVEILTSLGYSVLEAADGQEALQTCKRYHGPIGLLFTDVVMPKMNGAELAQKVIRLRPEIKVLFMSGYTDDAVVRHGILQDDVHFLQKPVTPKALSQVLRKVLGPSPS
jgi:CheY-like chemotaxis protein